MIGWSSTTVRYLEVGKKRGRFLGAIDTSSLQPPGFRASVRVSKTCMKKNFYFIHLQLLSASQLQ